MTLRKLLKNEYSSNKVFTTVLNTINWNIYMSITSLKKLFNTKSFVVSKYQKLLKNFASKQFIVPAVLTVNGELLASLIN